MKQAMTCERALELLSMCTVMGAKPDKSSLPLAQAVRVAIRCVELQIKENPVEDSTYHLPIACPKCGTQLTENLKHCPECGKAIKWY